MQQYVSTRYYFDRPMKSRQLCASSQRRPPVSSIQGASTARLQSLQAPDRLAQLAEVAFEYFRHRSSMPMPSCDVWQPLEALCLLVWRVCSFFITSFFMSKPKRLEEKKYGTQTREIKLRDLIIRGKVTLDVSTSSLPCCQCWHVPQHIKVHASRQLCIGLSVNLVTVAAVVTACFTCCVHVCAGCMQRSVVIAGSERNQTPAASRLRSLHRLIPQTVTEISMETPVAHADKRGLLQPLRC